MTKESETTFVKNNIFLVLLIIFSIFTNIPILSWILTTPAELIISGFSIIAEMLLFFL